MFSHVARHSPRELALQLPALVAALVIAELFYKFGSFTLECVAFLATWFVLDYVRDRVMRLLAPRDSGPRVGGAG